MTDQQWEHMIKAKCKTARYEVVPVNNDDREGGWAVRDNNSWTIESRHRDKDDAKDRAAAKNKGLPRA